MEDWRLKIELRMAVEPHKGGAEAQNGALEDL